MSGSNSLIAGLFTLNLLAGGYVLHGFNSQFGGERILWALGLILLLWVGQRIYFYALGRGAGFVVSLAPWLSVVFLVLPLRLNIWIFEISIVALGFVTAIALYLYRRDASTGPLLLYVFGFLGNLLILSAPEYEWTTLINSSWADYLHCWFGLYFLVLSVLLPVARLLKA